MSDAASVRSVEALRVFQSTLRQTASSSADAVRGAESAAGAALHDLNERLRECERARQQAVRELEVATTAFVSCLRSGTHDDEGHYHPPNCSAEERVVDTCQHRVREAEQQVARVKSWVSKVEGEVQAFRSQAQRLRNFADIELRRADMLLAGKVADLEAYLAARTTGTAADGTAGATYAPFPSVPPADAPRLVSVRSSPSPEVLASPEREPRTVVLGRGGCGGRPAARHHDRRSCPSGTRHRGLAIS